MREMQVISSILLLSCMLLGCNPQAEKKDDRNVVPADNNRDGQNEDHESADVTFRSEHEHHDDGPQPFGKPGMIVPGLGIDTIIATLAKVYNADSIKESLGEGCRMLSPVLRQYVGDEIVDMTCGPILESLQRGTPLETSDLCMELWTQASEHQEHQHYSASGMENPGFDERHEDGMHFNYYDQHQNMYADFPMEYRNDSKPFNPEYDEGPSENVTDQYRGEWISPNDAIMFYTSMILGPNEFPQDMIRSLMQETFEVDPSNPASVCGKTNEAMMDDSRNVQDWLDDGIGRVIELVGRLTPWICDNDNESPDNEASPQGDNSHYGLPPEYSGQTGGPSLPMGEIIGGVFSYLGNFENPEQLCITSVPAAEKFNSDPDELAQLVSSMKAKLFSTVESQESCMGAVSFINILLAGFGFEESFVIMLGFDSDESLCAFVIDAFDPTSAANNQIDITGFFPPPVDKSYQESQPPPIAELLKITGKLYNANTLKEGLTTFCNIFDQTGQISDILGSAGARLCANGGNLEHFYKLCTDHLKGFSSHYTGDEHRFEDHGPNGHRHDMGTSMFYDHNSPLHGVMKVLANRYGLFDVMNPYSVCDAQIDIALTPMEDLTTLLKETAAMTLGNLLQMEYPMNLCDMHNSAASGHSDEPAPMPETMSGEKWEEDDGPGPGIEPSVEDLLRLAAFAADVEDHAQFCELITTERDSKSDHEQYLNKLASSMVSKIFSALRDVRRCTAIADIVRSISPEMFYFITGKQSGLAFCSVIVDAFNAKNSGKFRPPPFPDLSFFDSEEMPFQAPGQILSFVSVEDVVKLAGKLYNQVNPLESARVLCNSYGRSLSKVPVPEVATRVAQICSAIKEGDTDKLTWACYTSLVPLMFGPEHPIALRTINVPYEMMKILLPMAGHPVSLEKDNICSAEEAFLNSDLNMRETVDLMLDGLIPIMVKYGNGICNNMTSVYNYLKPKPQHNCYLDYNGHNIAWDGTPCEDFVAREMERFDQRFQGMFKLASTLTGFRNKNGLCKGITNAVQSTREFKRLVARIKERFYSFITEDTQCSNLLNRVQEFAEIFIPPEELQEQFYQVTGFLTPQALCVETVRLFNRREKEVCRGIVDCAGVCNGNAIKDCTGECMGPAVRDCARQCNGNSYENHCGYCVGGSTRRRADFGTDKCGICRTGKEYRITWDCRGTCNGTAFYDKCGECVGGDSRRSENWNSDRIDCRGFCDGGWIEDACGYCDPPPRGKVAVDPSTTSKHRDCHGTCHQPGTRKSRKSRLNECGVCIGGDTGLEVSEGINACGQCLNDTNADESSCAGCDGVPNSGKEIDACGACGGDGSDCVGVSAVSPEAIQEGASTKLAVFGAGFSKNVKLECVFIDSAGVHQHFEAIERVNQQKLFCEPNLRAGVYEVKVERDGFMSQDVSATLTVYEDIQILEMTPTDLDLGDETFELFLTADDDAFTGLRDVGTPYVIAEGDVIRHFGERFLIPGKFADDVDNELQFVAPVPDHSLRVHVWGSLDGINKLSMDTSDSDAGMPITFWAEEPMFTSLQFDANGASLTARFDLRVAYERLESCDDIFDDTTKLGQGAECVWKGPKRLKVVIGKGDDLIEVGDELTLKEGAVRTFKEDYSYSATGSLPVAGPRRPVKVKARLRGTERITSCGKVRLTGRKSKGGAGRAMTYAWTVSSDGNVAEIQELLSDFTGADFNMDGSLMDADTIYTFEMTATNFLGSSDVDTIEVSRSATATPEVTIIPKGVDISNVLISKKFKLTADVTFYSGCVPPGKTVFTWSVDNDDVPLNLRTINKRTLFIDANTLPGDQNITFTIRIYKESDPDTYVEQSVTVTTHYSDLMPVIEGGNELTIGRDAGNMTIDGSSSFDPDDVAMDMTYEWLCEQVTDGTACWSYKIGEQGQFFPSAEASTKSELQFDALAMEPEKMYTFTLVTSKGSRSATSSVNVQAMNGDPPRVKIRPIDGKVRSDRVFSLKAKIYHTSKLSGFAWETVDTELASEEGEESEAFAYLDLDDEENLISPSSLLEVDETRSVSFLSIKRGKLTPGSAYMFQLNVSTVDGQYGLAKVDLHILAEVTSCSFGLVNGNNDYTELDKMELLVENCAADDTAYPLTYQMFMVKDDEGGFEAFTERQSEPLITGVGKPAREGTDTNTFVAKVCDNYGSCRAFSKDFSVTTKDTFTAEEAQELKETLVEEEKFKQNYMTALVNYNTISQKVDISFNSTQSERRRREAALETSAQAAEQLELMEQVLESTVMDTATAQLQIDQLSAITTSDMTLQDQSRLLDVVIQLMDVFVLSGEESISESGIDVVLGVTADISHGLDPQFNAFIFEQIDTIEDTLSLSLMSQIVVGGDAIETVSEFVITSIQRAIPSGIFQSKSSGGASIHFGAEIAARFGADWACSSGSCTGVAIHYDHYETDVDFLSTDEEDQNRRAADIISIAILDPDSREGIIVEDLTDPITINMTLSIPKSNSFYECSFWNTTTSEWSTEGVFTVEHSSTVVECITTHLSQFTVMAQRYPTSESPATTGSGDTEGASGNTGVIIGSVLGGVAAVTLISIVVAYVIKGRNRSHIGEETHQDQEMQRRPPDVADE